MNSESGYLLMACNWIILENEYTFDNSKKNEFYFSHRIIQLVLW